MATTTMITPTTKTTMKIPFPSVGVLFDVLVRRRRRRNQRQSYNDHYTGTNDNGTKDTRNENDQQKKRKEEGAITSQPLDLPWKIR
eukprot:6236723-Ditylum_brightwellii.AAC.1